MKSDQIKVSDFSAHLFWDMDQENLDFDLAKNQVIVQVVEYGTLEDWKLVLKLYNKEVLKETLLNAKSLDKVTLAFLANYFGIDKSAFKCYKQHASPTNFWNC